MKKAKALGRETRASLGLWWVSGLEMSSVKWQPMEVAEAGSAPRACARGFPAESAEPRFPLARPSPSAPPRPASQRVAWPLLTASPFALRPWQLLPRPAVTRAAPAKAAGGLALSEARESLSLLT